MGRVRDWWGSRHATKIRACRGQLVNLHQGRRVGRKRRLSLWSTGRKDHAPSGETKFKPEMAQSITDAISTGGNGGMWWNNGVFCNELINYAVRIVLSRRLTQLHLKIQVALQKTWPHTSWQSMQKLSNLILQIRLFGGRIVRPLQRKRVFLWCVI